MKKLVVSVFLLLFLFSCTDEEKTSYDNSHTLSSDTFTLTYNYIDYKNVYGACANDTNCAVVKIHYPNLLSNSMAINSINNTIRSILLNYEIEEIRLKSFDEIADSFFSLYKDVQSEFSDYDTPWFIHKTLIINGIFENYLSIKNEVTMYTGGANSFYNIDLSIFDLNSGDKQTIAQFITRDKMTEFNNIGERRFRKLKDIPENQTIKETGYWFEDDKFYLPDNFSISDSGFVFIYNLYEIAPRSEGYTELFIPKEDLKNILQKNKLFN